MGENGLQKCAAEFIGTFALIFIGAGSICVGVFPDVNHSLLAIAIAHGLVIAVMVSATGHISGGHLNPAVTFGALITRKISAPLGLGYVVAQLLGAVAAAFILSKAFDPGLWQKCNLGTPTLSHGFETNPMGGAIIEAILTFFLVFVVFGTGIDSRGPKIGGLAIGGAVALDILLGGPLTGAAMNPARVFGPALIGGYLGNAHWVYWVGPLVGGGAAALVYDKFVGKPA